MKMMAKGVNGRNLRAHDSTLFDCQRRMRRLRLRHVEDVSH
jgi:hypothetical protein